MKWKVNKAFYDRKDGASRSVGSIFDCTEGRAKEINGAFPGTLEKVPARRATKKEA